LCGGAFQLLSRFVAYQGRHFRVSSGNVQALTEAADLVERTGCEWKFLTHRTGSMHANLLKLHEFLPSCLHFLQGFLLYKAISSANKLAEEMDKEDGVNKDY
jgi:hypothetical protein